MAVTDAKIRAAKADEKPYKLADTGNIHLLVHPNGSRCWLPPSGKGKNAGAWPLSRYLTV